MKSSASTKRTLPPSRGRSRKQAFWLLLLLIPLPSLGVLAAMAFPATRGTMLGSLLYGLAKFALLAIPLALFIRERGSHPQLFQWNIAEVRSGVLWGLVFMGALGLVFTAVAILNVDLDSVRQAAHQNGLATFWRFLFLAGYLSFLNSLAEEFVWRFFIYSQWRHFCGVPSAILLTNLAFTLHHLLALLFQTQIWLALLAASGVFAAGCLWSWLFAQRNNLTTAYLSHVCADLAIFGWSGWFIYLNHT